MRVRLGTAIVLILAFAAGTAWAEELKDVEKKIIDLWQKHKSMTADLVMTMKMEGQGMAMEGRGEGTMEVLRKGDDTMTRVDLKTELAQKMGDSEMKMTQDVTMVIDPKEMTMLQTMDMMGQKQTMAQKMDVDPEMSGNPKQMFEAFHESSEMKLLEPESVDGTKVWVIEVTPKEKPANPQEATRTVLHFSQESGALLKTESYRNGGDSPMQTVLLKNVKFDADVKPDRFELKIPEGVEMMDMRKSKTQTEPAKPTEP